MTPNNTQLDKTNKWKWKMEYCEKHRLPPAQHWAWTQAEQAYNTTHNIPDAIPDAPTITKEDLWDNGG